MIRMIGRDVFDEDDWEDPDRDDVPPTATGQ